MNKNEKDKQIVNNTENKLQIVWRNVIVFVIMHSITFYGVYLIFSFNIKLATLIFSKYYSYYILRFSKLIFLTETV